MRPGDGMVLRSGRKSTLSMLALKTRLRAALRLVAAGDAERERVERDLHDGVQQRLTALRIRLALAADATKAQGDDAGSQVLADFGDEVEQTSEELRAFAQGVYPPQLTWGGLSPAFNALGSRSPGSVTMLTGGLHRYPREVETAVYFSCLAATQNAAKHASGGRDRPRLG
jgi:signal transduction histidine kinase